MENTIDGKIINKNFLQIEPYMKQNSHDKPFEGIVSKIEPYQVYYMNYDTGTGNNEKTSSCVAVIFKDIDDNLYEFDPDEGFRKFKPKYFIKNILKLEIATFYNGTFNHYFNKNKFSYLLYDSHNSWNDLYCIVIRNDMDGIQNLKIFIGHLYDIENHSNQSQRSFNIYNPVSKTWTKVYDIFSDKSDIIMWFKLKDLKLKQSDDELQIFTVNLSSDALLKSSDDDTDLLSKLATLSVDENDNPVWSGEVKFEEQEIITS